MLVAIAGAMAVTVIADLVTLKPGVIREGYVVSQCYSASTSGTGTAVSSDGKVGVVLTSSPAKYVIFIRAGDADIEKSLSRREWMKYPAGTNVRIVPMRGGYTGKIYGWKILQ